jgi:hypothetical protein
MEQENERIPNLVQKRNARKLVIIIGLSLIIPIVCLVVYFAIYHQNKNPDTPAIYFEDAKTYYYGIGQNNDGTGLKLENSWAQDLSFDKFRLKQKGSSVNIDNFLAIPMSTGRSEIQLSYENKVVANYIINVHDKAKYIDNEEQLANIQKNDVCIQTRNINITKEIAIDDFSGEYYGNYFSINNLKITSGSGLFGNLTNARISSLIISDTKVNLTIDEDTVFGVIAGNTYASHFYGIEATGEINVLSDSAHEVVIGTLFGKLGYDMRSSQELNAADSYAVSDSYSKITINITSNSRIIAGGIAGGLENLSIKDCTYGGSINIKNQSTSESGMLVGGVIGFIDNKVPTAGLHTLEFIKGENLTNEGGIVIKNINNRSINKVGGIFGEITNTALSNCYTFAKIEIVIDEGLLYVGGILGYANKSDSVSSLSMYIENSVSRGTIDITAKIFAFADAIAAFGEGLYIMDSCDSSECIINLKGS